MRVSLVVPVLNEASSVQALLDSALAQTRPPDEVVIVDGGSEDRTPELVREWSESKGRVGWIRVIEALGATPGVGRNVGAASAHGDWIAFTDAGIRLQPDWLSLLSASAEPDVDVVLGSYEPDATTPFGKIAAVAYVPPREPWGGRGAYGASVLVRRSFFQQTDGFPAGRAAEDLLFFDRIVAAGARIRHAPGAIVVWRVAPTVRATFRRFASYSYHNLTAGMGRRWHAGVLRLYLLLAAVLAILGWVGAGMATTAVIPLFFLARALKAAWLKRNSFAFETLNPATVLGAALLLVTIDAATLAGAVRWWGTRLTGPG